MLIKVLQRAKDLITAGKEIYAPPSLSVFLNNNYTLNDFDTNPQLLNYFAELDDFDIYASLKYWKNNPDFVLSSLSDMILNRKLLKIKVQNVAFKTSEIENKLDSIQQQFNISKQEAEYFAFSNIVSNSTYNNEKAKINILMKNGDVIDIDAKKGSINVRLTSAQLKARRKKWKEKKSSFGSGTIWKYAQTVGPAYLGAPTHPGKKKEVKEYSKI
jgi:HD superfamily phosphohydrolase